MKSNYLLVNISNFFEPFPPVSIILTLEPRDLNLFAVSIALDFLPVFAKEVKTIPSNFLFPINNMENQALNNYCFWL